MIVDINRVFYNEGNAFTNQHLIRCRELLQEVIVKEWVVSNQNMIDFNSWNKLIVKLRIQFYHEWWERHYVALHDVEVWHKAS